MRRLIFGPRAVTEALRAHASEVAVVYVAEAARKELREVADLCARHKVVVEERSPGELDTLAKSERHQGVIAIGGSYSYLSLEELTERLPIAGGDRRWRAVPGARPAGERGGRPGAGVGWPAAAGAAGLARDPCRAGGQPACAGRRALGAAPSA